jgi:hypothetical protein
MRTALTALAIAAALLTAACGGSNAKPTPTAATASPTTAPSPTPRPTDTPTSPWLLYEASSTGDFSQAATRSIRLASLATGSLVSTFDYGNATARAVAAFYAPTSGLVWVTQDALRVGSLDGVKWQKDYVPPDGWHLSAAALSHGGRYAAVSAFPNDILTGKGEVAIVDLYADIMTGGQPVVMRFDHANPRLAHVGDFGSIVWLAGDNGVVVFGMTYNEGPAPAAYLMLNGDVAVGDWRAFSPDGRFAADAGSGKCGSVAHPLSVRDASTGSARFTISDPNTDYVPEEWAPDGSALLYAAYEVGPFGIPCDDPQPAPQWWIATPDGQTVAAADADAVRRNWYGPNVVELRCTGVDSIAIAPPTNGSVRCPDPYRTGTVSVGGVAMGTATVVHTLGIVQP